MAGFPRGGVGLGTGMGMGPAGAAGVGLGGRRSGCKADYKKGPKVGEGTYGVVRLATEVATGRKVAIKKVRLGMSGAGEGLNFTAVREIKLLRELHDESLVNLLDVFHHNGKLNLVFEAMETDLDAVLSDRALVLGMADVKSYLRMLLQGVAFCHRNYVVHRDIKPNNLLLAPDGSLRLADFGLARIFGDAQDVVRMTPQVFARWYRAPELLFGARAYGAAVDMWAVGCVFAGLVLRRVWLDGATDMEQLGRIFAALGTPQPGEWPGVADLPDFVQFVPQAAPDLRATFPTLPESGLNLLRGLMQFDPAQRLSAVEALRHPFFVEAPLPTAPAKLPKPRRLFGDPKPEVRDAPGLGAGGVPGGASGSPSGRAKRLSFSDLGSEEPPSKRASQSSRFAAEAAFVGNYSAERSGRDSAMSLDFPGGRPRGSLSSAGGSGGRLSLMSVDERGHVALSDADDLRARGREVFGFNGPRPHGDGNGDGNRNGDGKGNGDGDGDGEGNGDGDGRD